MGGQESKPIPEQVRNINIYIQDESENKIIVELAYNALVTDLKKIIHDKINCTSRIIFCENTHISIYFNKSYNNIHRFSVDENDEICLNTILHYNIVEGDTVRYVVNTVKQTYNLRIVSGSDGLEKRGEGSSTGLF